VLDDVLWLLDPHAPARSPNEIKATVILDLCISPPITRLRAEKDD
jgi:hypothetical protein